NGACAWTRRCSWADATRGRSWPRLAPTSSSTIRATTSTAPACTWPPATCRTAWPIRSNGGSGPGVAAGQLQQAGRDAVQRQDFLGRAELHRGTGHTPDHAGGFVLDQGRGSSLAHFQQATRAIVAHAGEDRAHGV